MNFVPATGAVRCCNSPVELASYRIRHAGGESENIDWLPLSDELIGAVEDQFERAAFGKLSYGRRTDVTETQSQPGLIEIRLREPYELGEGKYRIRIYVVEPEQLPFTGIVTLLMHVKQDGNSRLNSMQNDFMATAMDRCDSWAENFPVV